MSERERATAVPMTALAARGLAWFTLGLSANLVAAWVMSGTWDRLPFLIGYFCVFPLSVRAPVPRTFRPVLPLLGRSPLDSWLHSPVVLVPTVVVLNAIGAVWTKDNIVQHLWLGLGVNVVLLSVVFLVGVGPELRPISRQTLRPRNAET